MGRLVGRMLAGDDNDGEGSIGRPQPADGEEEAREGPEAKRSSRAEVSREGAAKTEVDEEEEREGVAVSPPSPSRGDGNGPSRDGEAAQREAVDEAEGPSAEARPR
eukprot:CAMPEP_0172547324 /NCGR_PEP_ID=MMETSP1067-20121228/16896_1 /TAXON_ID=265564 ORGANISM="Thalassiosira punctigera, Strain Tpunct2005C2" /NCGR_SAMPLE_ID=MMETSP1067 /ASSEMBLY_ACC=CAM_ASM_000444 /LENGTH=105 /DNA_ID=CAMNT_0013334403 /DNA_START=117 /DNA_END=430 /DNA_ORIENTATION=+